MMFVLLAVEPWVACWAVWASHGLPRTMLHFLAHDTCSVILPDTATQFWLVLQP